MKEDGFYCPYLLDPFMFVSWQEVRYIKLLVYRYRGLITNNIEIGIDPLVELKRKWSLLNKFKAHLNRHQPYQTLLIPQVNLAEYELLDLYSLLQFHHHKGMGNRIEISASDTRDGVSFLGKLGSQRQLFYEACFSWRNYGIAHTLGFLAMWGAFTLLLSGASYMTTAIYGFVSSLFVVGLFNQDGRIERSAANKLEPILPVESKPSKFLITY